MFTVTWKKVLIFASCRNGCFDLSSAFFGNGQKQTSGCRCSALTNKSCVISRSHRLTGSEAQRLLHGLHLRGQPTAAKDHTATTARWKWNNLHTRAQQNLSTPTQHPAPSTHPTPRSRPYDLKPPSSFAFPATVFLATVGTQIFPFVLQPGNPQRSDFWWVK